MAIAWHFCVDFITEATQILQDVIGFQDAEGTQCEHYPFPSWMNVTRSTMKRTNVVQKMRGSILVFIDQIYWLALASDFS